MSDTVAVYVPAKINLALCVGGPRPDGFHELQTLFQAVSLYDELTLTKLPSGIEVEVPGFPELDRGNTCQTVAEIMIAGANLDAGVRVKVDKQIPVAGGMAGGSADAAGTALGIDQLFELNLSRDQLADLLAEVGSDAPFGVIGGTAIGSGRGEQLVSVAARKTFHWVIATTSAQLSTPAVFREYDRLCDGEFPEIELPKRLLEAVASGDPNLLGAYLRNDLETAAISLMPEIADVLALGEAAGAVAGMVSGSGPTVLFLLPSRRDADGFVERMRFLGCERTLIRVHGPVPGAQLG